MSEDLPFRVALTGDFYDAEGRLKYRDNVLLAPHSIAWTDELFRDIGRAACQGMLDLAQGHRPRGVVNPAVFDRPSFRTKWQRIVGSIKLSFT